MPTYLYEITGDGPNAGETFEWTQRMSENSLTKHPVTKEPVRKVYCAPQLSTRYTAGREKSVHDNRRVEKAGFTKYEKDKLTGRYHRTAGKEGPAVLDPKGAAGGSHTCGGVSCGCSH